MKRILLISPVPTHPQTAGNRTRIDGLLASLRQLGHDVYFLHAQREKGDETTMRNIWGDRFYTVPYAPPRSWIRQQIRKLAGLFNQDAKYVYAIDDWYDPSLDQEILKFHRRFRFDAVVVEYVFFSKALDLFGNDVLKIIDTHDLFTDRHRKYLDNGQVPQWFSTSRAEEAKGLDRADIIIAIQDKERDFFSGLTTKRIITVGHMVALHEPAPERAGGKKIVFVASDNPINADGINHFISESFHQIRDRVRDAELVLAGTVCKAVRDQPGIVKLGRVDDLSSVYQSASIVINPVYFNTGLSIKNLEALGYGKPLVTAPVGVDGLEDGAGSAFLVADDAKAFSDSITKLLSDEGFAWELSRRAFDFAMERNLHIVRQLEDILA